MVLPAQCDCVACAATAHSFNTGSCGAASGACSATQSGSGCYTAAPFTGCNCVTRIPVGATYMCQKCPIGRSKLQTPDSEKGQLVQCTPCTAGKYAGQTGASKCTDCPVLHYQASSSVPASECTLNDCISGTYMSSTAELPLVCSDCAAGMYQDVAQQGACKSSTCAKVR